MAPCPRFLRDLYHMRIILLYLQSSSFMGALRLCIVNFSTKTCKSSKVFSITTYFFRNTPRHSFLVMLCKHTCMKINYIVMHHLHFYPSQHLPLGRVKVLIPMEIPIVVILSNIKSISRWETPNESNEFNIIYISNKFIRAFSNYISGGRCWETKSHTFDVQ